MSTALIVGGGLIGMSFAQRFVDAGWDVHIIDVRPKLEHVVKEKFGDRGAFFTDLEAAAKGVDFVQEAGPENLEAKRELFMQLGQLTAEGVVLASSSSAILPSKIAEGNPHANRILIGHPFTPPAIMPVLEVVPGKDTEPQIVDRAMEIYRELGFDPSRLKKEINGFVGNRIQKVIMWEAIALVQEGVIDVEDLDRIVRHSLGLRYAAVGPFEANRLGGGPTGGMRKLVEAIAGDWDTTLAPLQPDLAHMDEVYRQVEEAYGNGESSFAARSETRDAKMRGFLKVIDENEG
ncbi:3-hydroxyacyl-CoA dehydrogenase NAD-binding domain-containing protein [Arcanobacterium canis]|uniref:3-hydroxyacyl-CoA dehydrogenase NAD-binding domain-containing protein n=1 Tax=Arcanobacterium canis TaxID=999183 RepID=A0ABY8FXF4_9ACTO|nr:3-hydroxyacyl-CoA dehydrogenase NAD-binding domain-containing protein [Arcanobacterium canis]WFM83199.1 3-hydroxyacyl-CoA dehydrogenase NAD-binding domain-containing protein [Arcanobacterium canis]